ncbi:MAG: Uma2 family endonuclease [Dehalococcoidia bacterium]
MVAAVATRRMTLEEFEQLADTAGLELIHGEPKEMAAVSEKSSWLNGQVYGHIWLWCRTEGQGLPFPNDTLIACWPGAPNHARKPDTVFYRPGRLPRSRSERGAITVVPDLVVEVLSTYDQAGALQEKLNDYREAGVPLIWVIFPDTRDAWVYHASSSDARYVPRDGALDGEDVMPGFRLPLEDLFAGAGTEAGRS